MSAGPIRSLPITERITYSASGLQDHCGETVTPLVHFVAWVASMPRHEVQMVAHHARQLAAILLAAADDADGVPVVRTDLEWLRLPEIFNKFTDYAQDPTDANALRIIQACAERNAGVLGTPEASDGTRNGGPSA